MAPFPVDGVGWILRNLLARQLVGSEVAWTYRPKESQKEIVRFSHCFRYGSGVKVPPVCCYHVA